MVILYLGIVRYFNLVTDKQKNVYINACSGVGRIFSLEGRGLRKRCKVLFPVKLFLKFAIG